MSNIPEGLRYSEDHEWLSYDAETGIATIGITDYAQGELGDIVFLEFPEVGQEVKAHDVAGTIEAVKTVAELFSPISGAVSEVNLALDDHPETVNSDPYGDGWMMKMKVADEGELDAMLDSAGYAQHVG